MRSRWGSLKGAQHNLRRQEERRLELVERVREHIEQALQLGPVKVQIRAVDQKTLVLDRLGKVHAVIGRWSVAGVIGDCEARNLRNERWSSALDGELL